MSTNLEDLKNLEYSLKYSGFIINMIAKQCGGDAWLKSNYNISNNQFIFFEKKARKLNIIEKIDMNLKYKLYDINHELLYWIGNKQVVEYITYDIKKIIESETYELYLYDISSKGIFLSEFTDIFDSIAMEGLVFIFKSKQNISSISLHWSV